jgi:hypothetical protein
MKCYSYGALARERRFQTGENRENGALESTRFVIAIRQRNLRASGNIRNRSIGFDPLAHGD